MQGTADQHIWRYAELLEKRVAIDKPQQVAAVSENKGGRGNKGTARLVAEETGLSVDTVRRALNPRPVQDIKPALEPEAEHDATIREANAIVSAWNRARQEAGALVPRIEADTYRSFERL